MQCHICIFFIYKYLCDILWLYAQSSNSCLIKCITPIDIFGFAIEFDSSIAIEDEYGNTPTQRAELDWLLYNKLLEYAQMVLGGEIEHFLSLGCDHGGLED